MDDPTLRLYAVVRADLEMSAGKMSAQAGHAFLEAFRAAKRQSPIHAEHYVKDPPGTKVVLKVADEKALIELQSKLNNAGIPTALITDSGHVFPPHFDGSPIVTALGFGPSLRREVWDLTFDLEAV